MVGWLGAQRIGEAGTGFAETVTALGRRRKLDGAMAVLPGKTEEETKENGDGGWLITRPRKQEEATTESFPRQREAKAATRTPGSKPKVAGDVARAVNTVPPNYRIAICF